MDISSCEIVAVDPNKTNTILDVRYSTENNFTHEIIYTKSYLMMHTEIVEKFKSASLFANFLGYKIKVFDSFRPLEAQRALFAKFSDGLYISDPDSGLAMHTRGLALDITLVNSKTNLDLDMGTNFDDFTQKSSHSYNIQLNKHQALNRSILVGIMVLSGFSSYQDEWWHYHFLPSEENWQNLHKYKKCTQKELNLNIVTNKFLSYIK